MNVSVHCRPIFKWFFVSSRKKKKKFGQHESLNKLFLSRKARNFFPDCIIKLYDKNSESDYFFFLHQNQNIIFSNIGNQNIFLEKKHNPPFKLNGPSLSVINYSRYISVTVKSRPTF